MSLASSATAFSCLALGLADLLYMNLAMVPALFEEAPEVAAGPSTALQPAPVAPASIAPEPIAPEAIAPESIAPEPIAPEPIAPEPVTVSAASVAPDPTPLSDPPRPERPEAGPARPARTRPVTVSFARDRDDLTARARAALDRVAARLSADPSATARIDGHTDRVGDSAHNLELSQRRAERVADHLAALGIDRGRMIVRALGERRPLERDADAAAHRRNRRVEVLVVAAGSDPALRPEEEAP
jgi:outer membrane protein OmpA-like peptidoglycan-associated protein